MKRPTAKDGSIPTHPIVPVDPDKSEAEVLKECLGCLHEKNIFCNRHDVGAGDITGAGYATYGIKGAGDIIGLFRNGIHFEIETKAGKGGRLSEGQQKRQENIMKNNGIYWVIHGISELYHYLKDLDDA